MVASRPEAATDLRAALARLEALNGLSAGIAAARHRDEIMRLVVKATAGLLGAPYAALWIVDAAQAYMTVAAGHVDEALGPLPPQSPVPVSRSFATTVLREGRPVALLDVRHDPRWVNKHWPGLAHLGAYLGVPLARDGALVGILAAMDRPGRRFTDDEAELLGSLATHAGLAIDKAELLEAARQATEQAKALVEVGKLLAETVELDIVLARIGDKATELLDAPACSIGLLEGGGDEAALRFPHMRGLAPAYGSALRIRFGEAVGGKAIQEGRPVWTLDALNDPALQLSEETRQLMLEHQVPRAILAAPMIRGETAIGVLTVHRPTGSAYTPADVAVITALAGQAAIAIQNARLFEAARQQEEHLRALLETNRKIGALVPLDLLLESIAEEAGRLLAAEEAGFRLVEGDDLVLAGRWGEARDAIRRPRLRLDEGLSGWIVTHAQPLVISDVQKDPRLIDEHRQEVRRLGHRAFLGVPLKMGERVTGALTFRAKGQRQFTDTDVQLATAFADQAAVALRNARLFEDLARSHAVAKRQAEQLQELHRLGVAMQSAVSVQERLDLVLQGVHAVLGLDRITIFMPDLSGKMLECRAALGNLAEPLEQIKVPLGREGGVLAKAFLDGGEIIWTGEKKLPVELRLCPPYSEIKTLRSRSFVIFPLVSRGRVIGLMSGDNKLSGCPFTEETISLLRTFAGQGAIAIENARLYAETERRRRVAEGVNRVSRMLTAALDLETATDAIGRAVVELLNAPLARVYVGNPAQGRLVLMASAGEPELAEYNPMAAAARAPLAEAAFESGTPVLACPIAEEPRYMTQAWAARHGLQMYLCLPLLAGGQKVGVLTIHRREARPLTEEENDILLTFASQAAIAIENARLYAEAQARLGTIQQQHASAHALLEVTQSITQTLDLDRLFDLIVDKVLAESGADACGISALTPGGDLEYVRGKGFIHALRPPRSLLRGEGVMGRCLELGAPVWSRSAPEDPALTYRPETLAHVQAEGIRGSLAVPITTAAGPYGVLFIGHRRPHDHSLQEIAFAQALAAQAAIALHNARLYEESQRRAHEAAALAEVARALSETLDMDRVFEVIVEEVRRLVGVPFAGIMKLDEKQHELAYVTGAGMPWEHLAAIRLKVGEGIAGQAVEKGDPVQTSRLLEDPRILFPHVLEAQGFRSFLCVPLVSGARPLGVLAVSRREEREFSPAEVQLLTRFADQAAVAIENARLYQRQLQAAAEAERQRARAEALAAVGQAISASLDLDPVLALVAERAAAATGAEAAAVLQWDSATGCLRFRRAHGIAERDLDRYALPAEMGIAGAAMANGMPVWTRDLPDDPRFRAPGHLLPLVREESIRGTISVPIRSNAGPFGVLSLYWRTPHTFEEGEIAFASRIAEQAAIAIENARLYREVAAHAETLEARVRERTAELEKANRAKTEFLTTMSHELRTPLNAIIGFSEMLHMQTFGPLTPKQQRYVANIKTGGVHLLNLVNDVLDLARVEAGRLVLHHERVPLPPILTEALDTVRPQAEKKALALACEPAADLPPLWADPIRLRQILVNLLSNAVKFTPTGGRVVVRARSCGWAAGQGGRNEESVEIQVEDSGIGLAPEDLARLFRKFEQLDGGPSNAHQGTGLGLALTRGLVELHGGTIAAASDGRGRGATFTVHLPVGAPRQRPTVLVVDDDPVVLEMLTGAVRGWGWEAAGAASLAESRGALQRATPDLIILDVRLGDGSGVEFAQQVRHGLAPHVPILMYTGLGAAEGEAALEAGADDYVVKPAPLEVIRRKAAKLLAGAGWSATSAGDETEGAGAAPQGAASPFMAEGRP